MSGPGREREKVPHLRFAQPNKPFAPFMLSELQQSLAHKEQWPLLRKKDPTFPSTDDPNSMIEEVARALEHPGNEPIDPAQLGAWEKLVVSWQVGEYTLHFGLTYEVPEALFEIAKYNEDALLSLFPSPVTKQQEKAEERQLFLTMSVTSHDPRVAFDLLLQPEPDGVQYPGKIETDELGDMIDVEMIDQKTGKDTNFVNHILVVPADPEKLAKMQLTIITPQAHGVLVN